MMIIKTAVKPVEGKGLGLFSEQDVATGCTIWRIEPHVDQFISVDDAKRFEGTLKTLIETYATRQNNKWFLDGDGTRFMNHSETPNVRFDHFFGYAIIDIKIGDELTCDYRTIDDRTIQFEVK